MKEFYGYSREMLNTRSDPLSGHNHSYSFVCWSSWFPSLKSNQTRSASFVWILF